MCLRLAAPAVADLMDLFDDDPTGQPLPSKARRSRAQVEPADPHPGVLETAGALPASLHLGTSSWSFPGWRGLVWRGDHSDSQLSRAGLKVYSRHPLLRCVSLDRSFYRPLSASEYAAYAAQVPEHFRFVVKAPSLVCDSLVRGNDGRAMQDNPAFLDPVLAVSEFVQPAIDGLGSKIGALVFQLSPLPRTWIVRMEELLDRLAAMLGGLPRLDAALRGRGGGGPGS